jgi:predicted transcriptional regulator
MVVVLPEQDGVSAATGQGEARAARLRREAEAVARGHADIERGLGIDDDDLEAWLDQLDRDETAPLPRPGTQPLRR